MDSGADSTTHCIQAEGRRSSSMSSAFLELSYVLLSVTTSVCLCFRGNISVWFYRAFSESGSAG